MHSPETTNRRGYRTAVAAFAVGMVVGGLLRDATRPAQAQMMPNGWQQRVETNQGLDRLNDRMGDVLALLKSGTLQVRVVETDKTRTAAGSRGATERPAGAALNYEPIVPPR